MNEKCNYDGHWEMENFNAKRSSRVSTAHRCCIIKLISSSNDGTLIGESFKFLNIFGGSSLLASFRVSTQIVICDECQK